MRTKSVVTCLVAALFLFGATLVVAAYKSRVTRTAETGLAGINYFEDFMLGVTGAAYEAYTTGTGSVNGQVFSDAAGTFRSTTVLLSILNDGDEAAVTGGWLSMAEGSSSTWAADLAIRYPEWDQTLIFGLIGSFIDPQIPLNGAWFKFDPTVSNNWIIVRMVDGTPSQTVTSVPVTGDFTRLKMVYDCDRVVFFINAEQVGNVSTGGQNTTSVRPSMRALLTDTDLSAVSYTYIDYSWTQYQFPSPRPNP